MAASAHVKSFFKRDYIQSINNIISPSATKPQASRCNQMAKAFSLHNMTFGDPSAAIKYFALSTYLKYHIFNTCQSKLTKL